MTLLVAYRSNYFMQNAVTHKMKVGNYGYALLISYQHLCNHAKAVLL